jgi:hypothetical protein
MKIAAAAIVALACLAAALHTASAAPTRSECGHKRWTIKTLQDKPQLLNVKDTTVAWLTTHLATPNPIPLMRTPAERAVYRVTARVTDKHHAPDDDDYHIVLRDAAGHHMIAESPAPTCTASAQAALRQQMAAARSALTNCAKAVVTGVLFFDFPHHQTGAAPNQAELHPILSFHCTTP